MAHVPRHRSQPRKPDGETFDMLDISRKPKSLIREETLPRFAKVIAEHGYTDDPENRSNFVRYMEDVLLPTGIKRGKKNIEILAIQGARAYRFYEQLQYLHQLMINRMNEDNADHDQLLASFKQQAKALEPDMKDAVTQALKALNRSKYYADEDLAMLLEIPYMALRGSKSLLIIANNRGIYYEQWARKYPYLWTLRKGPGEIPDHYEEKDEDFQDLIPTGPAYRNFHKSPRPIWWGDMNLGPFSRICRRLVKIKKKGRKRRLHSPALLLYWRTRPKPSFLLGPNDDFRT